MSVFRRGNTIPVAFVLRRANGATVAPVSAPRWTDPVRGSRITAPVNETAGSGAGSAGNVYTLRSGRWQYDWATSRVTTGYAYRIGVRLDDGTTRNVTVAVR